MAKKRLVDRLLGFMGIEEDEVAAASYEDDVDTEEIEQDEIHSSSKAKFQRTGKIVNLHTQKQVKLIVAEPRSFDDVQGIADHVKSHRPVIVNMEDVDRDLVKRMIDFLGGVTYALDGAMQKVGEGIFLLTPDNVDVAGDIQASVKDVDNFTWGR